MKTLHSELDNEDISESENEASSIQTKRYKPPSIFVSKTSENNIALIKEISYLEDKKFTPLFKTKNSGT